MHSDSAPAVPPVHLPAIAMLVVILSLLAPVLYLAGAIWAYICDAFLFQLRPREAEAERRAADQERRREQEAGEKRGVEPPTGEMLRALGRLREEQRQANGNRTEGASASQSEDELTALALLKRKRLRGVGNDAETDERGTDRACNASELIIETGAA